MLYPTWDPGTEKNKRGKKNDEIWTIYELSLKVHQYLPITTNTLYNVRY